MKLNKSVLLSFVLLIVVGSVFRVLGYAPQIAMAVFGLAVIKDKRLAFLLPLVSMFLSDVLYQVLYLNGLMEYGGFYEGQLVNYVLVVASGLAGLLAVNKKPLNIVVASVSGYLGYFVLSNFAVWLGGGGLHRPKTAEGLMQCYADALPFLRSGLVNTLAFSVILFAGFYLLQRFVLRKEQLAESKAF